MGTYIEAVRLPSLSLYIFRRKSQLTWILFESIQFQRTQKFDAILGGAEEVLGDLGVRQASRKMRNAVL